MFFLPSSFPQKTSFPISYAETFKVPVPMQMVGPGFLPNETPWIPKALSNTIYSVARLDLTDLSASMTYLK